MRDFYIQKLLLISRSKLDEIRFLDEKCIVYKHIMDIVYQAQIYNHNLQLAPPGSSHECICSPFTKLPPITGNHMIFCPLSDIRRNELYCILIFIIVIYPQLSVGMLVRRSIDWKWEDQDGGPGKIGEVIKIVEWKSQPNKGVKVKWFFGKTNKYRYGGDGCYDVELYINNII